MEIKCGSLFVFKTVICALANVTLLCGKCQTNEPERNTPER